MTAENVLEAVAAALRDHFGQTPVTASITFLGVEPIDVVRFEPIPGETAYLTHGMSRHPMTASTETAVAADGPRAELMLHVRTDDRFTDVWRRLAVLGAAPAVEGVVYTPGMTIDMGEPLVAGTRCTGGVIDAAMIENVPTEQGEVRILQVTPATSTELAWSRVHGTPALQARWRESGTDLLDLARSGVRLD